MAKSKYIVLIPLNYNDGTKVADEVLDEIYDRFFTLANGYALAGTVVGAYRMKDRSKQVDHSTAVWVGIENDQYLMLRQLVAEVCGQLKQETIYLERPGGAIEFVAPIPSGGDP